VVAIELARAAADGRRRIVVVDANELSPSVAQQLNLPVLPNVRIAVDAVRSRHHRLTDALIPLPDGGFWVLGGLADPAQWAEVTPAEVAAVVDELAQGCELVVAHGGPVAEDLAGYGGPDRFGITRRLLADADAVVAVAPATPGGVAQLSGWMADVRLAAPGVPVHVALVRAPADRFRRAELTERLSSDLEAASVTPLPDDARVERALWDGGLVRRGPFRRAVGDLATALVPPAAKRTGGRRRG
jgi:MinD-like ATPase involved in chromosome partitioning or flagellar assembly